jgi:hypothetical protein
MKPEYKAEYDALNLPLEFHVDECGSAHGWSYWGLLDQRGPADVLIKVNSVPSSEWEHEESHKRAMAEFITKAANEYHALKSAVEELRGLAIKANRLMTAEFLECKNNDCTCRKGAGLCCQCKEAIYTFSSRCDEIIKQTEGLV